MTPEDQKNAIHAYKTTLKGIIITFIICNVLILTAVVLGFMYTLSLIKETNKNLNDKIDRSYAAWADFGKIQSGKINEMTDEIKLTNKLFFETLGVTVEDFKSGRKEMYEKLKSSGKDALLKYLNDKVKPNQTAPDEKLNK